jgi:hypothetical protein
VGKYTPFPYLKLSERSAYRSSFPGSIRLLHALAAQQPQGTLLLDQARIDTQLA